MVQFSFGQNELLSTWQVSCPMEKVNGASGKFCGLCPMNQKDINSMTISDFEMTVDKEEIKFNMGNIKSSAKYILDNDLNAIRFKYNGIDYTFKVLLSSNNDFIVLKNTDGLIVTLVKKH